MLCRLKEASVSLPRGCLGVSAHSDDVGSGWDRLEKKPEFWKLCSTELVAWRPGEIPQQTGAGRTNGVIGEWLGNQGRVLGKRGMSNLCSFCLPNKTWKGSAYRVYAALELLPLTRIH